MSCAAIVEPGSSFRNHPMLHIESHPCFTTVGTLQLSGRYDRIAQHAFSRAATYGELAEPITIGAVIILAVLIDRLQRRG